MEQEIIEKLKDFECEAQNVISIIHEEKKLGNPNTVTITYILQYLEATSALIRTLVEIESKKS